MSLTLFLLSSLFSLLPPLLSLANFFITAQLLKSIYEYAIPKNIADITVEGINPQLSSKSVANFGFFLLLFFLLLLSPFYTDPSDDFAYPLPSPSLPLPPPLSHSLPLPPSLSSISLPPSPPSSLPLLPPPPFPSPPSIFSQERKFLT